MVLSSCGLSLRVHLAGHDAPLPATQGHTPLCHPRQNQGRQPDRLRDGFTTNAEAALALAPGPGPTVPGRLHVELVQKAQVEGTWLLRLPHRSSLCARLPLAHHAPLGTEWCFCLPVVAPLQTPIESLEPILREDLDKVRATLPLLPCKCTLDPFHHFQTPQHRDLSMSLVCSDYHCAVLCCASGCFCQIWTVVPKPEQHKDTSIGDFFNVRPSKHGLFHAIGWEWQGLRCQGEEEWKRVFCVKRWGSWGSGVALPGCLDSLEGSGCCCSYGGSRVLMLPCGLHS